MGRFFIGFLLVVGVVASCGGPGATSSTEGSLGCSNGTLDTSVTHVDLDFAGAARSYELHVPASYDGAAPVAVILNFHGLTQTGDNQRDQSHMDDRADEEGFLVAYPNGIDNAWNSGGNPDNEVDDVGFTRALIDDLGVRGLHRCQTRLRHRHVERRRHVPPARLRGS